MSFLRDFYKGKSVLVTGHTGFKGSWMCLWLSDCGAEVHGYSLAAPTTPSLFEEARVRDCLRSHVTGDVCDAAALEAAVRAARPQIVFHMAAQSLVRRSYREPARTYEVNVLGTVNVLEAVRRAGSVRVCQVITTDKCYENREWVYPYRENDRLGGFDPYSSSKACAELATAAYRTSFFNLQEMDRHHVSVASVRAGNIIGGGDWAEDRIIPDCVRSLEKKQSILVRNPSAVRPWQHVLEPLSGYLSLAARQWEEPARFSEPFNFGPEGCRHVTVEQVVKQVLAAWGEGEWHGPAGTVAAVHEANMLALDITKAATVLHWRPTCTVEEAIRETVGWYRQRASAGGAFDARSFTLKQIRAYEAKAKQIADLGLPISD